MVKLSFPPQIPNIKNKILSRTHFELGIRIFIRSAGCRFQPPTGSGEIRRKKALLRKAWHGRRHFYHTETIYIASHRYLRVGASEYSFGIHGLVVGLSAWCRPSTNSFMVTLKFRSASPLAFFYLFNVLADQVKQEKIPNLKRRSKEVKRGRTTEGLKDINLAISAVFCRLWVIWTDRWR